jgi:hypothetical protein
MNEIARRIMAWQVKDWKPGLISLPNGVLVAP